MRHRALTADERSFVEACRALAAEVIAPGARGWDEANTFPAELHQEAARRGIAFAGLPAELGGRGVSHVALALGGLEMARRCAPATFTLAFDQGALRPLITSGTEAQRDQARQLVARGGHAAWCMTEPSRAGSDVLDVKTRAVRRGGRWVIDGEKCMVGMGTVASLFFVLADGWDGDAWLGPTVLAVPREAGVQVGANPLKLGFRCLPTPDVSFAGVEVGDEAIVGKPGGGLPVLLDSLDYMRLGGGVVIAGLARGALDEAGPWLDTREVHGGVRLGDTSHVQVVAGRLLARLAGVESLLLEAASALDEGARPSETLAAVKVLAADLAIDATSEVAQLFGWRGVREDHGAAKRLRDARQTSVYEGTTEVLAMRLYRAWAASRGDG